MLLDLQSMGDMEFCEKWDTSRQYPIRTRKRLGIKSFNNQHGTVEHRFEDDVEYKWCQNGHWEVIGEFGIHSSRWDGLRGLCKHHDRELPSAKKKRKSWNTRKNNGKQKKAYVLWEYEDEVRALKIYDNRCGYCGVKITDKNIEFDHIVPISKGGKTIPENMIPSCVKCNRGVNGKRAKDLKEWLYSKYGLSYFPDCIIGEIKKKQKIIKRETKERVKMALLQV